MSLHETIADYWKSYGNSNINNALVNFEFIEKMSFDLSADDLEQVAEFIEKINNDGVEKMDKMKLIVFLNRLPAAYMFYSIHQINRIDAKYMSELISMVNQKNSSDDECAKFYQRNMVFERFQILSRIFSSERLNKIISCVS
ncbi:type IVB secretion system protein IcmW [Piscirickettsia litoralis]|nr:type IVB secretion system protein IcmW [Piscirickettsia litoralis]